MDEKRDLKIEQIDAKIDEKGEGLNPEGRHGTPSENPTARHLQVAPPPRRPYWNIKHVIGASRNLPSDASFTLEDNVYAGPGLIKSLWLHYKRWWILYTILAAVALAIGLPIL